jgi:hypothetical protein
MNDEKENLVFWERVRGVLSYIRRLYTKALGALSQGLPG